MLRTYKPQWTDKIRYGSLKGISSKTELDLQEEVILLRGRTQIYSHRCVQIRWIQCLWRSDPLHARILTAFL